MKIANILKLYSGNTKLFYTNLSLFKKKNLSNKLYRTSMEAEAYRLQVLPAPDKALCDKKEYR